jgi:sugar phosphate isomerase/epimerase
MRFGVCAGSDKAAALAAAGYDYIELGAGGELIPDQDEAAWNEKRRVLESLPLPCETFNLFIRGIKIVGPDADPAAQERYAHHALARAAQVGGKLIVFGSGGARRVPDGYSREQAEAEILRFLGFCADAHEKTGVVVVVEPLNHNECNILNSIHECAGYVRRINRPGIRNLADSYHMEVDGEPLDAIVQHADILAHAHTADTGRVAPGTAGYDHHSLFRAFRAAAYDERLSIECKWTDFDAEIGPALAHLKSAYAAASAEEK